MLPPNMGNDDLDGEDGSNPFGDRDHENAPVPPHLFAIQSCMFMRNTGVGVHEHTRRAATSVQSTVSCNRACVQLTRHRRAGCVASLALP
jgi:hypothetical protein